MTKSISDYFINFNRNTDYDELIFQRKVKQYEEEGKCPLCGGYILTNNQCLDCEIFWEE